MKEPALDPELVEIGEHIEAVLDAAYHRMGCVTPRRNGRAITQMVTEAKEGMDDDELWVWLEAWRGMMSILWQEGPSPERALKRLMAFTWAVSRESLANMSMTDLALLTHETRAAWSHRVKVVYSDYLKSRGYRGTRVPGQKSEGSTKVYARVAAGNTSRRSGRKKGDTRPKGKPPRQSKP